MARVALLAAIVALLAPAAASAGGTPPRDSPVQRGKEWRRAFESAERYAREREGRVSFALVDDTGMPRSHRGGRRYPSASVVKAMLLVAYLNRTDVRDRTLGFADRANLRPMITRSDNDAAARIHAVVGSRGLERLARRARMQSFATRSPGWSNTQITAADQARFFARVDRLVARRHRRFARYLLGHVIERQRWGIPRASPRRTRVFLKGGWRRQDGGWLVHQVALVETRRERVALAVLTDRDRTRAYGHGTIRGVAERALSPLAGR